MYECVYACMSTYMCGIFGTVPGILVLLLDNICKDIMFKQSNCSKKGIIQSESKHTIRKEYFYVSSNLTVFTSHLDYHTN